MNAPNLDCMSPDELASFYRRYRLAGPKRCASLFDLPPSALPPGYTRVARSLADYAATKRGAMRARLAGNIATALTLESVCDSAYDKLPDYARW